MKQPPPVLTLPSNFRPNRLREQAKHMVSCDVLPRYSSQNRSAQKQPRLSQLTDEAQPLKSSQVSMIEELEVPAVQSQRLVQDYVERLQRQLKHSRRLNQHYEQKLKQYRTYVTTTRREVNKELDAVKTLMRMTTDQILKQVKAAATVTQPSKSKHVHTQSDEIYCDQREPTFVTFQDRSPQQPISRDTYLRKDSRSPGQSPQQDYCQEIENVMGKIDELKQDVHSAKAFKKDILNRIDANLRRVGGVKKTRGYDKN